MRVLPLLLYLNKYNGNVVAIESHSMVYNRGYSIAAAPVNRFICNC